VEYLDLTRLYSDATGTLYQDDCCHVSDEGYLLLVEPLAAAILQAGRR
jgi:hypothetical protein